MPTSNVHRQRMAVQTAILCSMLALPGMGQAATCTIFGQNYTVTDFMTAGVPINTVNTSINVIQGTGSGDTIDIDERDKVCSLGSTDVITVHFTSGFTARIDPGDGNDVVFAEGSVEIDSTGNSGAKDVVCNAIKVKWYAGAGKDVLVVDGNCQEVDFKGGGNDDKLVYSDCSDLHTVKYNGEGGADILDHENYQECSSPQPDETLTSVEDIHS